MADVSKHDRIPSVAERNWAGNYTYTAHRISAPTTVEQLQRLVVEAKHTRALGTRHSFNAIADSAQLISLARMPSDITLDHANRTARCSAGTRYGDLASELGRHDLALHNLASLPDISIAGAVATGTHGSGDTNGNLATAVGALDLVTADGDLLTIGRGDHRFEGVVVGLGALGVVTHVTLDVRPAYQVRQRVFEELAWDTLSSDFDAIFSSGYSVSAFTRLGDSVDQVWVKSLVGDDLDAEPSEFFGAHPATADRHPIDGLSAVNCTLQLGAPGPWHDRLPHFRSGLTPSNGDELQAEFLLPRHHASAAIGVVRSMADDIRPLLQICEIRTVAGDDLWMSPQFGRASVGIHFTLVPDPPAVDRLLTKISTALEPFGARPHWAKLFTDEAGAIASLYPRHADFVRLVADLDPTGKFRNEWLERHVLGGG